MFAVRKSASPYLWLPAVASAALAATVLARRTVRLAVDGHSMAPTYLPGDRVVAVAWRRPRVGDVVALRDPRRPSRTLVKRVVHAGHLGFDVRGDNAAASTDSRHFGPVSPALMRGIVVLRYGRGSDQKHH